MALHGEMQMTLPNRPQRQKTKAPLQFRLRASPDRVEAYRHIPAIRRGVPKAAQNVMDLFESPDLGWADDDAPSAAAPPPVTDEIIDIIERQTALRMLPPGLLPKRDAGACLFMLDELATSPKRTMLALVFGRDGRLVWGEEADRAPAGAEKRFIKEIARIVTASRGRKVILAANARPSAPTPDSRDIRLARLALARLDTIDARLADFIAVTPNDAFSFRMRGFLGDWGT
jgi:hypothetical protein